LVLILPGTAVRFLWPSLNSSKNGVTWSAPVQLNTNPEPLVSGLGTDANMPGVAVDNSTCEIGVCWCDRRNDPLKSPSGPFQQHATNSAGT